MESPEEIIKKSKYKGNELIEEQGKIIEALVQTWNSIIMEYENKTILFALRVKDILKGYPDKTISEIIDKVRTHPDLKQPAHSKDRIMQGLRLVNERPDLIEFSKKPVENKKKVSFKDKPYCKRDGNIFWEFYFQMYKYNIDPGLRFEFEKEGKEQLWSCRRLQKEMSNILDEKREPNTRRRFQKRDLIKEIVVMLKELQPDDMNKIKEYILKKFNDKLINYKKWKELNDQN